MDIDDHDVQKSTSIAILQKTGNKKNVVTTQITPNKAAIISAPPAPNQMQNKSTNARRRKAEDKMAMIFIAIVTGWLVTNFPRILLNFQEVIHVEDVQKCLDARMQGNYSGPPDP